MVAANVVGFFASIPQEIFLNALRDALDNTENKHIPTDNLLKMGEFVLKTITLNLMVKLKNSCKVHPLEASLHQRMAVFLWIT